MADEILEQPINQAEEDVEENPMSDAVGAETPVEDGVEALEETVPSESEE
jgi:hypothetical protein